MAKIPAKRLSADDSIRIGTACFNLVHAIEAQYGLAGVRAMKAWCREKLPFGAFDRGHFDEAERAGAPR